MIVERKRGRAAVRARARHLAREPLCRRCKARGFLTVAEVVDHIVPLALGGSDHDRNKQSLCKPCHDDKTAEDFGKRSRTAIGLDGYPEDHT